MITSTHLQEAKARIDELTMLTGHNPGTPEWLEEVLEEAPEIDAGGLLELAGGIGRASSARADVEKATLAGAVVVLLASAYAKRDGEA